MKAAVCYSFDEPLVVEEIKLDAPQRGEVKVKVAACAVCHSDVHKVRGEWGGQPPLVAGHEAAGIVSEVGPGVDTLRPGDHVVVSLLPFCGRCPFCAIGQSYSCEASFPLDRESRLHTSRGVPLQHGLRVAGFAEYCIVDQSQAVVIPDEMPLDRACLLACGVITGIGAATNTARVEPGSSVVVVGIGGVGLNTVQGAVLSGAAMIVAVDVLDGKLEAARLFGATHTINGREADVLAAVRELTGGRGADYAFATVGSSRVIAQIPGLVRKGGTAVIVGMPPNNDAMFTANAHELSYDRTVKGSFMGSSRLHVHVPQLVQLYQQGRLKLDELITARYPLEEINEAMAAMERGEALRNVIVF